jgi:hypothetical protein
MNPKTEPHWIGKVDGRGSARQIGSVENAVGGECEGALWMTALPAAGRARQAAHCRRILRLELIGHVPIDLRRQSALQGAVGWPGQEHVVPFRDAWRRDEPLTGHSDEHNGGRGNPGARARSHFAGENDHCHDQQQRIRSDMVDRHADNCDRESKRGNPAPSGAVLALHLRASTSWNDPTCPNLA